MSEHDDLYDRFQTQVNAFERHRSMIDKATALEGQFRAEVVKVVVDDHTERSLEVVSEIMTVLFEVESVLESLNSEKADIEGGTADQRAKLEELELNLMIEAISQEDFDAQSAEITGALAEVDTKLSAIGADLERFDGTMARWTELGTAAGVLQ